MKTLHSFKQTFTIIAKNVRVRTRRAPLFFLAGVCLAGTGAAEGRAAGSVIDGGVIPAGDWRVLADLATPASLADNFDERGSRQFAGVTGRELVWSPNATNLYTAIHAVRGRPVVVSDLVLSVEFQLDAEGGSFGLHLHGAGDSDPSHLVLVNRSAPDRGLIRAYRTALWPSLSIPASAQITTAQARLTRFPSGEWYRLTVRTRIDDATGRTALSVRLADLHDEAVGTLDVVDPGSVLPSAGTVALRLFSPAGGVVRVRNLLGQPGH